MVKFKIDGEDNYAFDCMTWAGWVNTPFNTLGYYIQDGFVKFESLTNEGFLCSNVPAQKDDFIKEINYKRYWSSKINKQ